MAYCSHCAAILDPNLSMCPKCGQPYGHPAPTVLVETRPWTIRAAVALLLISWGASMLTFAALLVKYGPNFRMLQTAVSALLWVLFILFLWQRQNWARIATLALIAWVVGHLVLTVLRLGAANLFGWSWAAAVVEDIMRLCAACLLLLPESNAWFRTK